MVRTKQQERKKRTKRKKEEYISFLLLFLIFLWLLSFSSFFFSFVLSMPVLIDNIPSKGGGICMKRSKTELVKRTSYKPFKQTVGYPVDMPLDEPNVEEIADICVQLSKHGMYAGYSSETAEIDDLKIEKKCRGVCGPYESRESAEQRIKSLAKNLVTRWSGERNHNIVETCEGYVIFYDIYNVTVTGRYPCGEVYVEK